MILENLYKAGENDPNQTLYLLAHLVRTRRYLVGKQLCFSFNGSIF